MFDAAQLQPFDVLLYRPTGIFGRLIKFHTGYNISHVEVFVGRKPIAALDPRILDTLDATAGGPRVYSTASRDGKGVDFYPLRLDGSLAYVLRPKAPIPTGLQMLATAFAQSMRGTPYGWIDLIDFCGYPVNGRGIVCSPYATVVLRQAGIDIFNGVQPRLVAPYLFRTSERLTTIYTDGKDAALDAAGV